MSYWLGSVSGVRALNERIRRLIVDSISSDAVAGLQETAGLPEGEVKQLKFICARLRPVNDTIGKQSVDCKYRFCILAISSAALRRPAKTRYVLLGTLWLYIVKQLEARLLFRR